MPESPLSKGDRVTLVFVARSRAASAFSFVPGLLQGVTSTTRCTTTAFTTKASARGDWSRLVSAATMTCVRRRESAAASRL
jgi:hypothetical protein